MDTGPLRRVPGSSSAAIVDGVHGGDPHFYFLPPLVPPPTYSGTFDASMSPTVTICALSGSSCGTTIASFSGSQIQVNAKGQFYQATWTVKGAGLDPSAIYRIEVQAPTLYGPRVLGYADVLVLANGSQIKTVDKTQYVAMLDNGSLAIRFRIENGAGPASWQDGDLVTYGQMNWPGDAINRLLGDYFNVVYAATFGVMEVGIPGSSGYSMRFTDPRAVADYLPASGSPGVLNADLLDPSNSSAGSFGGEAVALELNVDYADAGVIAGASGLKLGDLILCNVTSPSAASGTTVRQVLAAVNNVLGGGASTFSVADLQSLAVQINGAFAGGTPSTFAQQHIGKTSNCTPANWRSGDVITLTQDAWAARPGPDLLVDDFNLVYASTFGVVEVGTPGTAGYSMRFSSAGAVMYYLPTNGIPGPLTTDLFDPSTSSSGVFGGEVLSLQLNVDFSDAGYLVGKVPLKFGDLTLCGLTDLTAFNGSSVRQVLAAANAQLGGGPATYAFDALDTLVQSLNYSFDSGYVSQFAQDHLQSGACK